ncbi:MAG: hypothetical protein ACI9CF_001613 [Candidatus Omnitrophota bacterium]|jgi:hypothetical protein
MKGNHIRSLVNIPELFSIGIRKEYHQQSLRDLIIVSRD